MLIVNVGDGEVYQIFSQLFGWRVMQCYKQVAQGASTLDFMCTSPLRLLQLE